MEIISTGSPSLLFHHLVDFRLFVPAAFFVGINDFNIRFWSGEKGASVRKPVHNHQEHGSPVHYTGPVHEVQGVVLSAELREVQDRNHHQNESTANCTGDVAELAQIPRTRLKSVSCVGDSEESWHSERDESSSGTKREHGVDSDTTKQQTQQTFTNEPVEPHSVDWGLGVWVDSAPEPGQWDTAISGVGVEHSGGSKHTREIHDIGQNNGERSKCNNSIWSDNLGIGRFLCQVEWSVESRHDPNGSHETHEHCKSIWPLGHVDDFPGVGVGVKFWKTLFDSVISAKENDPCDEQEHHVQSRGTAGDDGDPFHRQRGNTGRADSDRGSEQETVPFLVLIVRIANFFQSQNHGSSTISDGGTTCDLRQIVGPSDKPGQERFVFRRGQHGGGIIQSTRGWERRGDLGHRQSNTKNSTHRNQVHPCDTSISGVGHGVPQCSSNRGQKTKSGESDGKGGEHGEVTFQLLLITQGQNNGLIVVHWVIQMDLRMGNDRLNTNLINSKI
ncbi:hypothetical protein OGAPHI_000544 [Ogataea philodendri]|uniref:Uncharacterized protein n=1 Tax=Ogataea philodendri TaxID=1378263 RepID=A0A9P8PG50_9ASCO|nr:uncharacterized protein OGAPHI_000544 [Ogataea philodendri]KAH3671321.1 hypothetical protein OGAPHI_000544 [Ogataea philodendri]